MDWISYRYEGTPAFPYTRREGLEWKQQEEEGYEAPSDWLCQKLFVPRVVSNPGHKKYWLQGLYIRY